MGDKGTLQMELPELATPSRTTDEFAGGVVNYVEVPLSDNGSLKQVNVPGGSACALDCTHADVVTRAQTNSLGSTVIMQHSG